MPDRTRLEPTPDGLSLAERDSRIEELLLTGLDHYFAGEFERATSAWTRVLFLDRGHARAKAYIDRARSAVAERQRESEELLHRGVAAFNRGEAEDARRLLTSAVERGGSPDVALAFLGRLARLDRPGARPEVPGERPVPRRKPRRARLARVSGGRRAWVLPLVVLGVILSISVYLVVFGGGRARAWLFPDVARSDTRVAAPVTDTLPVPRPSEIHLDRARALLASGHARDALRLVERVRVGDPLRPQADELRESIQRSLLSAAGLEIQSPAFPPASPPVPPAKAP